MNKITISLILSIMIYASCTKEEIKPGGDLPTEIKTFLSTHYPNQSITDSVIDKTDSTTRG